MKYIKYLVFSFALMLPIGIILDAFQHSWGFSELAASAIAVAWVISFFSTIFWAYYRTL